MTGTSHVERQKGKDEDSGVRVLKEHLGDLSASERERERERERTTKDLIYRYSSE